MKYEKCSIGTLEIGDRVVSSDPVDQDGVYVPLGMVGSVYRFCEMDSKPIIIVDYRPFVLDLIGVSPDYLVTVVGCVGDIHEMA